MSLQEQNSEVPLVYVQEKKQHSYLDGQKCKLAVSLLLAASGVGAYMAYDHIQHQPSLTTESFLGHQYINDESFTEYLNFIGKYNKVNQTQKGFYERYHIFAKNNKRIIDHNKLYEQSGPGAPEFNMEVNKFTDLTDEEFVELTSGLVIQKERSDRMKDFKFPKETKRKLYGGSMRVFYEKDPADDAKELVTQQDDQKVFSVPMYKNWFEEGAVTVPIDQGSCGACWAFATAAATESLAYISGQVKELTEFSIQQLIDCDGDNYGCKGGWMYEGFAYVSKQGIVGRYEYPQYKKYKSNCEVSEHELERHHKLKNIGYREHDGRTNDDLRILLQKQPIGSGMRTTGMLSGYSSGILTESYLRCSNTSNEVNHGIIIVGYGTRKNEQVYQGQCVDYFIIRNSWGGDWGENGFFKLCNDNVGSDQTPLGACLINKYASWPTMDVNDIRDDE